MEAEPLEERRAPLRSRTPAHRRAWTSRSSAETSDWIRAASRQARSDPLPSGTRRAGRRARTTARRARSRGSSPRSASGPAPARAARPRRRSLRGHPRPLVLGALAGAGGPPFAPLTSRARSLPPYSEYSRSSASRRSRRRSTSFSSGCGRPRRGPRRGGRDEAAVHRGSSGSGHHARRARGRVRALGGREWIPAIGRGQPLRVRGRPPRSAAPGPVSSRARTGSPPARREAGPRARSAGARRSTRLSALFQGERCTRRGGEDVRPILGGREPVHRRG
jgi:hypothetical protein